MAHSITATKSSPFFEGLWRLADPKITLASVASIVLGAGAAFHDLGHLELGWLLLTFLGIFCIEAAKNASGEIFDFDSGTDAAVSEEERSPFSGGKRVLVDRLLTKRQTAMIAAAFYAVGSAVGLSIALFRAPGVLWIGLAGVAIAYFYHGPPLKLSYRGLGEAAVALTYGPLIAAGTYLVQAQRLSSSIVWAGIPLGLSVGAFLWINEFPDARADAYAGKRTLVVRLGRPRASRVFAAILALTFVGWLILPAAGLPIGVVAAWIGAPHAYRAAKRLTAQPEDVQAIVPAQAWTLASFVLQSIGAAIGMAVS